MKINILIFLILLLSGCVDNTKYYEIRNELREYQRAVVSDFNENMIENRKQDLEIRDLNRKIDVLLEKNK